MIIYPDYYCKNVMKITPEFLKEHNIKGLILDIDNTLIDMGRNLLDGAIEWHQDMVDNGFKTIILSNTNKIDKVEGVANALNMEYINFARKPSKKGFTKAKAKLNLPAENIAVIGDQIFTDVIGAKRSNMFAILVEPINKKEFWYTKWKRPIEDLIIKKYLKTLEKEGK
jgi:hypothetical protein